MFEKKQKSKYSKIKSASKSKQKKKESQNKSTMMISRISEKAGIFVVFL